MSGWLVGLPLTSGPVVFFLAWEQGATFAAGAAIGSLAGALAEAAFCLAYGRLAVRGPWPLALSASCLVFGALGLVLQRSALTLAWLLPVVVGALALAFRLMPRDAPRGAAPPPPRWDIPVRMAVTTGLVLALTEAAPALGPRLSGLLATFPLYAAILTVFAHRQEGPAPAIQVLRGLLLGLFSFAGFFVVLGALLPRAGVGPAFAAAVVAAVVVQAGSLRLVPGRQ